MRGTADIAGHGTSSGPLPPSAPAAGHFLAPARHGPPSTAAAPAPTPTATPTRDRSPWLHTNKAQIVTATGAAYTIRAVNWFGMETSNCAPHGLWQIKLGAALDEIKSWGFNTLRLPYANQCLDPGARVTGVDFNQNPDLQGLTPLAGHGQGGRRGRRPRHAGHPGPAPA